MRNYLTKTVRFLAGLVIGVIFLWLVLRQTSWNQVQDILFKIDLRWVIAAVTFYSTSIMLRVFRWRGILAHVKVLPFGSVATALLVGYAVNNILPARLGELFRADFTGRFYQVSRSSVVGTIFVERVLDGFVVVASLVLGQLFLAEQHILKSLTIVGAALFTSVFVALLILSKTSTLDIVSRWPTLSVKLRNFSKGLGIISSRSLVQTVAFSLMVWGFEGYALWCILNSVQVFVGWVQILSILGVVTLSTLLPSAPGFVGTYQYAFAFAVGLFGYEGARGVAAATVAQIFLLGSLTIVGIGLYIYVSMIKQENL